MPALQEPDISSTNTRLPDVDTITTSYVLCIQTSFFLFYLFYSFLHFSPHRFPLFPSLCLHYIIFSQYFFLLLFFLCTKILSLKPCAYIQALDACTTNVTQLSSSSCPHTYSLQKGTTPTTIKLTDPSSSDCTKSNKVNNVVNANAKYVYQCFYLGSVCVVDKLVSE